MADKETKIKTEEKESKKDIYPINLGTIFFGIFLVFVGFYLLAQNLNFIPEQYYIAWWNFWPLIFIFIGLSFLKVRSWISAIIGVVVIVVIIGLLGFFILWGQHNVSYDVVETPIDVTLEKNVDKGTLDVNFGAGSVNIDGGSENFVDGYLRSNLLELKQDTRVRNTTQEVYLDFKSQWQGFTSRQENNLDLSLNNELPVSIFLDSGASTMDLDLTNIKAEIVDINTGASDLDLSMGDKVQDAKLKIDAGASSLNIDVPKTVGVDLIIDSGITSKEFNDFEKVGDNEYRSRNYSDVDKYLNIDLDLGVSDLKINWK